MTEKDYVTEDVAKALREKGFNEKCKGYFYGSLFNLSCFYNEYNKTKTADPLVSAPSLAQAAKWLRENYGIFVNVKPEKNIVWDEDEEDSDEGIFWTYNVYSLEDIDNAILEWDRLSPYYETALNSGIKEALKMI